MRSFQQHSAKKMVSDMTAVWNCRVRVKNSIYAAFNICRKEWYAHMVWVNDCFGLAKVYCIWLSRKINSIGENLYSVFVQIYEVVNYIANF